EKSGAIAASYEARRIRFCSPGSADRSLPRSSRREGYQLGFADYRVALVTGASSGIGAATVRRLRAEGLEVHAMARDAERLAALAKATGCVPHALDVRATEEIAQLASSVEVDVLVNNAGQSRQG